MTLTLTLESFPSADPALRHDRLSAALSAPPGAEGWRLHLAGHDAAGQGRAWTLVVPADGLSLMRTTRAYQPAAGSGGVDVESAYEAHLYDAAGTLVASAAVPLPTTSKVGTGLSAVAEDPTPALGGHLTLGTYTLREGTLADPSLVLDGGQVL